MTREQPILDASIRIDRLPAAGRDLEVEANAEARQRIAEQLRISAVERLQAKLTVVRFRGGIRAEGRLLARIIQSSVVTLEPVTQEIDEPVDRVFLPEPDKGHKTAPGAEVFIDIEDEEFPDYIEGPEVDLSTLLIETLALAIDPYPRLPGESLEAVGITREEEDEGPFARLKILKNPPDKPQG